MKRILLIFFLMSSTALQAQVDSRERVTGTWVCKEVTFQGGEETTNPNDKKVFDMTRKSFLGSKFNFKNDNTFSLQTADETDGIAKQLRPMLNGKKWLFHADKKQIEIGIDENLMMISLKQKDGGVYFLLYETPIVLKMEKL